MTDLNYYDTFIAVADDCPAPGGVVPVARGGKKTVAVLQYEMLADAPHRLTQEDVLFETWLARQELPHPPSEEERAELRARFFSRSQACLRASPLPKTYGWGLLFDAEGRIALVPRDSAEYAALAAGRPGVKVLKAMRSKRA
ncbi:hypothetical protein HNP84_003528 [Thermocatellispora tengchongensis]|uniref:Uncharacterized protein n=1 Tax=Thermocatellispora tengchongensis TaxID=1073253 RepID=A0A840P350_9ACTN|nr:DUF6157 family protein [Thermocatellispora tengchongensis]MBB5133802.1 hypothetical protein [Thermocatellispora tengchongensis]